MEWWERERIWRSRLLVSHRKVKVYMNFIWANFTQQSQVLCCRCAFFAEKCKVHSNAYSTCMLLWAVNRRYVLYLQPTWIINLFQKKKKNCIDYIMKICKMGYEKLKSSDIACIVYQQSFMWHNFVHSYKWIKKQITPKQSKRINNILSENMINVLW